MKTLQRISENIQKKTFKNLVCGLNSASNDSLVALISAMQFVSPSEHKQTLVAIKNSIKLNTGFVQFLRRMLTEADKNARDKFLLNLVAQGFLINQKLRNKMRTEGTYAPTTVLISPTMRCNLQCFGCYAGKYSRKDDMSFELFDRIITEAEEMGVSFFTILGGETLFYQDLFKIFAKHKDSYFQFFTNGTLINDKIVQELKKLGNAVPMISVEGWEKQTDERRGKGTYQKIMLAMDKLKAADLPFGISVAVTTKNYDIISSDKFMDFMVKKGIYFCWWFLYMPIGREPDLKLMPTPQNRIHLHKRGRAIRKKFPIFLVDFWNDGPYVGGCIAGREYIHINSKGDVEPCIFTHFAQDNIKNKSLKEVMASEYFKWLRSHQPYTDNLYLPCMWIDHPEVSREVHSKCKVYPTHPDAECMITDKKTIRHLDRYSKEVEKLYHDLWKKDRAEFCQNCPKKYH